MTVVDDALRKIFKKIEENKKNEVIYRQDAIDEIKEIYEWHDNVTKERIIEHIERLPSAQSDDRLAKIAELVEGTIDNFDRDDAMDLLYQIKEVLKNDHD
ncbi:hypothetical protein [uncultured Methanobrevibacter sp.]|uniref:hypothetical protein n=1 Tax=uncultured Methanobrevibacter sp. TaxID=253161 RepID=UPI00260AAAD6|nr:hypothetical protein [uncultured Methanobrevibacter sp.]